MSKHTPGPWRVARTTVVGRSIIVSDGIEPTDVAETWDTRHEYAEANAILIAAAPDLLAACEAAEAELREYHADAPESEQRLVAPVLGLLRAAIVKAVRS